MRWLLPLCLGLLAGCSSFNLDKVLPDKQVAYKHETVADKHLEVPPDLTSSRIDNRIPGLEGGGAATWSDYEKARAATPGLAASSAVGGSGSSGAPLVRSGGRVLPKVEGVEVKRKGDHRWLLIHQPPERVWDALVDFWQENGILLSKLDPQAGFMETTWLENLADIPNDPITDVIRSALPGLYGAATRDRYRVRIEPGPEPGTTELYLTHFGMEQDFATSTTNEDEQIYWKIRPRDPDLEAIMLRKIMAYLGLSEAEARRKLAAARQVQGVKSRFEKGDGRLALVVEQPFDEAWHTLGVALDRVGFVVADRDRSRGIYYVRYDDPTQGEGKKGWLSKLAFWRSNEAQPEEKLYQVTLDAGSDESTRVTVHDDAGRLLTGSTAERILTLIKEKLK